MDRIEMDKMSVVIYGHGVLVKNILHKINTRKPSWIGHWCIFLWLLLQQPEGYTPVLNYEENRRHTHIDKVLHAEKIQYKRHHHAIKSHG